ncbi:MAG: SusC/RagA family TonB-linked outer membrane protein, partial [Cyclobacteriaceae bacterium]|nr:SusC/RagA family TonB-linked outer membrane protein [Cyclobacteriaceae bacterium]
ETGDALPGVSVMVKGTSSGTATDVSGKYSLSTSSGSTLVFSFIGYSSQEVAVGNQTNINVALAVDFTELQEIVVVGYGTQEKRDVTAAISTVSAQDVQELPVTSALAAMQGKVAGVDIQQRSGRPGENATIKIRGRRSINASNEPLYVVDGVPLVSGGSISDINQADIKSIEVLKDAAATAIYGSRGANGVILITTNRGESGQAKVSYNGYYGPTSIGTRVNIMDGYEFADMKRESRRVRIDPATNKPVYDYLGTIPTDAEIFEDPAEFASLTNNPAGIDYQDLIFNPGFRSSHQISISGGSEKTQYLMSANVYDELYPINTIDFHRKSFRLNLDQEIFDWLKVGTSTTITVTDQDYHGSSAINEAMRNNPLGNPWNADGTLAFKPVEDGIRTNPLLEVVPNAVIDNHLRSRFLASLYLDAKLAEGLNFRMTYGPDMRYRREARWRSSQTQVHKGGPPDARKIHRFNDAWILENLLTYNKEVASGHKLGLTFLQSAQESFYEYSVLEGKVLPTESFWNDIGSAESISADSDNTLWRMTSYMGRVNYSIADKYLLQATYRADANSVLAPGQKWSFFPGVSAGWRVIDEDFMQNVTAVSELKLRASYGKVGNSSIGPYQTWGGLSGTVYTWDGAPAKGYRLSNVPNPDLGWEYTETIDFGVDFGFMEGKISGSLDYYSSNTSDLLLRRQLPPTSGYDNILQNVGKTAGKGVE